MGIVLKPDRQEAGGFIQADSTGFQAKRLSEESSGPLLTVLRQEINKWAELEKQTMLPPALGNPQQLSPAEEASQRRRERRGDTDSLDTAEMGAGKSRLPKEMKGVNAAVSPTPILPSLFSLSAKTPDICFPGKTRHLENGFAAHVAFPVQMSLPRQLELSQLGNHAPVVGPLLETEALVSVWLSL